MKARVAVTLKAGVLDPQGKAIENALRALGIDGVAGLRQGKLFEVELSTEDAAEAEAILTTACERLLANTVVENFRIELVGAGASPRPLGTGDQAANSSAEAAAAAEMPPEGHP